MCKTMTTKTGIVLTLVMVAMAMFGLTTTSALAEVVLRVDFNSNQDGGGDSTTEGDPGLSEAAHNQEGWSSYHANHEVIDEFATADYDGITVTPDWPNTTDNRTRQSIDRGAGNDVNWDDAAGDLNLVTDWIGIDTRTGNGGNGDWDGTTGTPTYMTLALGGLAVGNYNWTSFHHDTEHCHGPFAVWLSTDGGATFTQLDDGIMTDSTEGGSPDSEATEVGPDANTLSSTYRTSFTADGNDVVLRFAPYSEGAVHRQIWGMNGFVLELDTTVVLFAEDFEGLVLGPNIDEGVAGDAVWTDTPPEGWSIDESGIPGIGDPATDGVTEWAGWAFADKEWWIETAGDQDRSLFTLGVGTVAIADPDEWDDADRVSDPIADNPYDTWLTTPAIDITGVEAGTIQLVFDSSWRPEFDSNYHQSASITASFDGGDPVEVLLWVSDEASPSYKPYATNETVTVDLGNPEGATSVVLMFGLFDAGNDWWWAIDNVKVISVPAVLPSPVGHWTLDEGAGNIVADVSGNGNDGIIMDNPDLENPTWIEGVMGGALEFHGTGVAATGGDHIDCGNDASLDIASNISIALWIRPDAEDPESKGTSGGEIAPMCKATGDWSWQVRYGWNSPQPYMAFTFNTSPRAWAYVGQNLVQGEWAHIACSHDGETLKCYLNGMETDSTPMGEIQSSTAPVLIGSDGWGSDWIGGIDDVRIYDVGLSEAEILDAMAGL